MTRPLTSLEIGGRIRATASRQPALVASLPEPLRVSAHSGDGQAQGEATSLSIGEQSAHKRLGKFGCALVKRPISAAIRQAEADDLNGGADA